VCFRIRMGRSATVHNATDSSIRRRVSAREAHILFGEPPAHTE
jgi:hypothetical protein